MSISFWLLKNLIFEKDVDNLQPPGKQSGVLVHLAKKIFAFKDWKVVSIKYSMRDLFIVIHVIDTVLPSNYLTDLSHIHV